MSLLAFLCSLGVLSGCSAISSRTLAALGPSPQPPLYFGGIRTDYNLFQVKSMEENWFWPGYCIMDMAFSFGADMMPIPMVSGQKMPTAARASQYLDHSLSGLAA